MNKPEIVKAMAQKMESTNTLAEKALEAFQEVVLETLAEGGKIQLVGFGTFEVANRKEREGRNPSTNQPMTIPASKKPKFKAGKQLKDAVK